MSGGYYSYGKVKDIEDDEDLLFDDPSVKIDKTGPCEKAGGKLITKIGGADFSEIPLCKVGSKVFSYTMTKDFDFTPQYNTLTSCLKAGGVVGEQRSLEGYVAKHTCALKGKTYTTKEGLSWHDSTGKKVSLPTGMDPTSKKVLIGTGAAVGALILFSFMEII